jgi:hypothetical protein
MSTNAGQVMMYCNGRQFVVQRVGHVFFARAPNTVVDAAVATVGAGGGM